MVGLILYTHGAIGPALAAAVHDILGPQPAIAAVDLPQDATRDDAWRALLAAVEQVDTGAGVLVLVDMFGGTPSNLAMALTAEREVDVLTGVNLPMALRAAQVRDKLGLDELTDDVLAYARRNMRATSQWTRPPTGGDQ